MNAPGLHEPSGARGRHVPGLLRPLGAHGGLTGRHAHCSPPGSPPEQYIHARANLSPDGLEPPSKRRRTQPWHAGGLEVHNLGAAPATVERPSLAAKLEVWKRRCAPPRWVRRTLKKGYALQFAAPPPAFAGILWSQGDESSRSILREEVTSLLGKGAIRRVPEANRNCGFYHRYFIVPKKDGSMRPILDLRVLNMTLAKLPFSMLRLPRLFQAIRDGDHFTSVDLKDAFFHVSVVERHRKYLRFAFEEVVYEFCVLPFGLSLSPRTFTLCVDAALAPLRKKGIRIFVYLDDALIAAGSRQLVETHTKAVTDHLLALGFLVNWKKSCLIPSQVSVFLGIELNSVTMQARLSLERRRRMLTRVSGLCAARKVSVRQCSVV